MFKLEFGTTNAAFDDPHGPTEVSDILAGIAESVRDYLTEGTIRDGNGATVGSWSYSQD